MKTDYTNLLTNQELGANLAQEITGMLPEEIGFMMIAFHKPNENGEIPIAVMSNRRDEVQNVVLKSTLQALQARLAGKEPDTTKH